MTTFAQLDQASQALVRKALNATENAYAPYSNFKVGSALLLANGEMVSGANIENASYPLCLCAERVALSLKSTLFPEIEITRLVVVAKRDVDKHVIPVTPCGACCQVLLEYEKRQTKPIAILMQVAPDSWVEVPSASLLLPFGFTREDLLR